MVISGTLVSKYMELQKNWNVKIIAHIPTGFPGMCI